MENIISTFEQLNNTCKENEKAIFEVALENEAAQGENSEYKVRLQAKRSLDAMKAAIKIGLKLDSTKILVATTELTTDEDVDLYVATV